MIAGEEDAGAAAATPAHSPNYAWARHVCEQLNVDVSIIDEPLDADFPAKALRASEHAAVRELSVDEDESWRKLLFNTLADKTWRLIGVNLLRLFAHYLPTFTEATLGCPDSWSALGRSQKQARRRYYSIWRGPPPIFRSPRTPERHLVSADRASASTSGAHPSTSVSDAGGVRPPSKEEGDVEQAALFGLGLAFDSFDLHLQQQAYVEGLSGKDDDGVGSSCEARVGPCPSPAPFSDEHVDAALRSSAVGSDDGGGVSSWDADEQLEWEGTVPDLDTLMVACRHASATYSHFWSFLQQARHEWLQPLMRTYISLVGFPILYLSQMLQDTLVNRGKAQTTQRHISMACAIAGDSIRPCDFLFAKWEVDYYEPVRYLCVDHKNRMIVYAVRGTCQLADMVSVLSAEPEVCSELAGGGGDPRDCQVHKGFLEVARRQLREVAICMLEALSKHPGYQLWLVGHSMGGAVVAIMSMLIRAQPYQIVNQCMPELSIHSGDAQAAFRAMCKVQCVTFGCPPTASLALSLRSRPFITTIAHGKDFATRLSIRSVRRLISQAHRVGLAMKSQAQEGSSADAPDGQVDSSSSVRSNRESDQPVLVRLLSKIPGLVTACTCREMEDDSDDEADSQTSLGRDCTASSEAQGKCTKEADDLAHQSLAEVVESDSVDDILYPLGQIVLLRHAFRDGGPDGMMAPATMFAELQITHRLIAHHLVTNYYATMERWRARVRSQQ